MPNIQSLKSPLPLFPLVGIDCGDLWALGRFGEGFGEGFLRFAGPSVGRPSCTVKNVDSCFFAHPLPFLAARHPRAPASAYECTTEAGEDSLERMLQSLLASGGRVGKKKTSAAVVAGGTARLDESGDGDGG